MQTAPLPTTTTTPTTTYTALGLTASPQVKIKPYLSKLLSFSRAAVFALQQCSGSFAVIFYAVGLFRSLGVASDAHAAAVAVGTVRFLGEKNLKNACGVCLVRHWF